MAAQITTPINPGGGGGNNLPSTETGPGTLPGAETGDAPGTTGAAPAGEVASGPGGGNGGGGGGKLPFTGLPAALVGALGAGLTAAGVTVRKALGRDIGTPGE